MNSENIFFINFTIVENVVVVAMTIELLLKSMHCIMIGVSDDKTYIVDGNVYLDDLEEETDIELESETSETVGGFIIDLMGEIPRENVKYRPVPYKKYDFTILRVRDRRIEKLRIDITDREVGEDE